MSAIIRDQFKIRTLQQFINSLATESLYLGIARPQNWDTIARTDTTVPVPENTLAHLNNDWEDMLSLKKINLTDAHFGIFKETWQANVKYDTYRHDWNGSRAATYNGPNNAVTTPRSIGEVKCVVVTANYNIYMCLKQSVVNDVVQPSIYSPETGVAVGTNTGIVKTTDGYYWKFIAATSPADIVKFSTKYYHPIETLTAAPAPADPYYPQWLNQKYSKSFKGGIYVINTLSVGSGYNGGIAGTRAVTNAETDAEFKVIGDGTGLQYTVTYGSGGSITDVEVTNPGSGYTHATISATTGVGASFDVIFSPMYGLGVDPAMDACARYLLINTSLVGAEGSGDFTITNDYRKILLVFNPTNYGTTTKATAATLDATIKLNVGTGLSTGAYPVDAIVTGATSGAKGRVVDFNATSGDLRIIRTSSENSGQVGANNDFTVGESVTSVPVTGTATILTITTPEVQRQSGSVLYSEYRTPVMRSELQAENINIIVKF